MDEATYKKLDLVIKGMSTVLVIATIAVGIHQYNLTTERDYKKTFWEKRLELYLEVSKTAAILATREPDDETRKSRQRFLELLHGDLVIVEDDVVLKAMKQFYKRLIDYEGDPTVQEDLQGFARDLANDCRESLKQSWDIPLKDISKFTRSLEDSGVTIDGPND